MPFRLSASMSLPALSEAEGAIYEIQSDPKLIQSVWMVCWCMWVPSDFRDCAKLLETRAGKNQFPFRPMVKT